MITDIQIFEILESYSSSEKDDDSEYVMRSGFSKVAKAIQAKIEKNKDPSSDIFRCTRTMEHMEKCRFQCEFCHEYFFQIDG